MSAAEQIEPEHPIRRLALLIPILLNSSPPLETSLSSSGLPNVSSSGNGSSRRVLLLILSVPEGTSDQDILNSDDEDSSFHDLLNRLLQSFEPQGPPPASKHVVDSLPLVKVDETTKEEAIRCSVCLIDFEIDEENVIKLPCNHIYHKDCVTTWLTKHCTCPVCRYELAVEDTEYERDRQQRMSSRHSQANSESQHTQQDENVDNNDFTQEEGEEEEFNNEFTQEEEGEFPEFSLQEDKEDIISSIEDDLNLDAPVTPDPDLPISPATTFVPTVHSSPIVHYTNPHVDHLENNFLASTAPPNVQARGPLPWIRRRFARLTACFRGSNNAD